MCRMRTIQFRIRKEIKHLKNLIIIRYNYKLSEKQCSNRKQFQDVRPKILDIRLNFKFGSFRILILA